MKQVSLLILVFALLCVINISCSSTSGLDKRPPLVQQDVLISTCESFFKGLKAKNFQQVWGLLTSKSKAKIGKEVADRIKKESGSPVSEEEIVRDFETGGPYSRAYWEAYVQNFDPDMALKDSKWEVGQIKDTYAEVILRYKTAERPAVIRLYKEGGEWRFGLVETFWTRK